MTACRLAILLAGSLIVVGAKATSTGAEASANPIGDPVLGAPTMHALGLHWPVAGDANENCEVRVAFREGTGEWKSGGSLVRVENGAQKTETGSGSAHVPEGARLFAGSILQLNAGTHYDLKVSLADPDGGGREIQLSARTISEPSRPKAAKIYHVSPGEGGGSGSEADPFQGIKAAQAHAAPATVFLLKAGTYPAIQIHKSGEPGRPIIWQATGNGEVVIEGKANSREGRLIAADDVHDVWFEGLTIRNGEKAIAGRGSARLVVRDCRMENVTYGIFATRNDQDQMQGWFVSDNVIEGPSTWPRTKGIESARGIQLTGGGHVVCYNRIRGFADAINTFPSARCADIDIHNNDISEMTDDGIELDYSERNVRCFSNRLTNVYQGISVQPIFGGPVYVFRNAIYNVVAAPFKMHNGPSGAHFYHNTVVKKGMPLSIHTSAPVRHCRSRNNLFIGSEGHFAFESTAKMVNCDFDYDGVGGGAEKLFLKWNNVRYATIDEVRAKSPAWKHVVAVEPATAFASGIKAPDDAKIVHGPVDLRLQTASAAIDAGEPITGANDGFAGKAPDLGAHEFGEPLPHYGPRKRQP